MKFNSLVPELIVSSIDKSISFYKSLGFKIEYERKENKFAFISLEGSQIMIQEKRDKEEWKTADIEYPFGRGINFQIEVKDIEKILNDLKKISWPLKVPLKINSYKTDKSIIRCKEFLIQDPDGYLLRFSQTL